MHFSRRRRSIRLIGAGREGSVRGDQADAHRELLEDGSWQVSFASSHPRIPSRDVTSAALLGLGWSSRPPTPPEQSSRKESRSGPVRYLAIVSHGSLKRIGSAREHERRAFGNHPDEVPRGLPPGGQALGLIEERTVLEAWALAERGLLEPLPDQFGPFEQRLELG